MSFKRPAVINIGLERFAETFRRTGVRFIQLDWRPPACPKELTEKLEELAGSAKTARANDEALKRLNTSEPVLFDVLRASEAVEGLNGKVLCHAGPPVSWEKMCGPMRGAMAGACVYEGWAPDTRKAFDILAGGEIRFSPCHHHNAVGPMAGVLSPSMYVWAVKNRSFGNTAFCSLNEGLGKVLRFGACSEEVIERLRWMQNILGPALGRAVRSAKDGINVSNITAQALQMGDECHNRNVAATGILLKELTPLILRTEKETSLVGDIFDFIASNPHFYLNLSMAACKASADSILGLENSTILSAMARNGTEIGIRVAGCAEKWFTAPAGMPEGLFFAGFSSADANPDIGDSTISEVAGIGGFAMAAAPAIVKFVGGTPSDALRYTKEMGLITHGRSTRFQIPQLDFAGTPTGIDILKVLEKGISPVINTGIAHKEPGIGQVGAGLLRAPFECFSKALEEMEIS